MATAFFGGASVLVILGIFRYYLHWKWGRCKSTCSMKGKTVIVTGANSGLGKMTARELARRGARIILACRDLESAAKAVQEIRQVTTKGELIIKHLDLASFASIRKFADNIHLTEPTLDVLINNAGVFQCPFQKTADGFETQFGVNHLGHFLLTKLLLSLLLKSASSRIVIVASNLYKSGKIDFTNLNGETAYDRKAAYSNSKLANVLFGRELAKRIQGLETDVYITSPGMVWTNLGRHVSLSIWKKLALVVFGIAFIRTPLEGCQTILHCATSDEIRGKSGVYYHNCKELPFFPNALDDDVATQLWEVSEELTSLK